MREGAGVNLTLTIGLLCSQILLLINKLMSTRPSLILSKIFEDDISSGDTPLILFKTIEDNISSVDTPGFGDAVDNSSCWEPVLHYVESQYEAFLEAETKVFPRLFYFCQTVLKLLLKYYVISYICVHFILTRLPETRTWRTAEFTRVSTLWRRRVMAS